MTDGLERIKYRLDAIEASQLAMTAVLGVLLQQHRGDPAVFSSLLAAFDRLQCEVLASQSTDYSIDALQEVAASYLQALRPDA